MYVETKLKIKPFCNSVSVLPSPVDEEQRASGIIVPISYDEGVNVARGVIIDVGACHCESWESLRSGIVVYYRGYGIKVGELIIVDHDAIVAYEEES